MDIKELKAEFEKLKYIEEKLEYLNFDEHLGCYVEKNNGMPVGLAAWVNGALYGFKQAATAQAVPEGFVLVPKEPTDKTIARMINTPIEVNLLCDHADIFLSEGEAYIAYKAMIEAQEPTND